jgi:hypothetical protein
MNIVESVQASTPYVGSLFLSILGFFLMFEVVAFCGLYVYSFIAAPLAFMDVLKKSLRLTFVLIPQKIFAMFVAVIADIKELVQPEQEA